MCVLLSLFVFLIEGQYHFSVHIEHAKCAISSIALTQTDVMEDQIDIITHYIHLFQYQGTRCASLSIAPSMVLTDHTSLSFSLII